MVGGSDQPAAALLNTSFPRVFFDNVAALEEVRTGTQRCSFYSCNRCISNPRRSEDYTYVSDADT